MKDVPWKDYALLTLFLIVIWGFTFRFYGDSNVISHVSLAATLISIVLSVIAILYTLYQSTASASHVDKLNVASSLLSDTADRLAHSAESLDDIRIQTASLTNAASAVAQKAEEVGHVASDIQTLRGHAEDLSNAASTLMDSTTRLANAIREVEQLKSEIAQSVEIAVRSEFGLVKEDIGNLSKHLDSVVRRNTQRSVPTDLKTKVAEASDLGLCVLYLLEKARQNASRLSFRELIGRSGLQEDYAYGFLVGFSGGTPYYPSSRINADFVQTAKLDKSLGVHVIKELDKRINGGQEKLGDFRIFVDNLDWTHNNDQQGEEVKESHSPSQSSE